MVISKFRLDKEKKVFQKPIFIGIAGASGSGKSLLASQICDSSDQEFGGEQIKIINEDCYYRSRDGLTFAEREVVNYDHPDALEHELLVQHLTELALGNSVGVPQYDYSQHNRSPTVTRLSPAKVFIVEGILIFHQPDLRNLLNLKIFVDVDLDVCLSRRLVRDINERGRTLESVLQQYHETVRPMFHQFIYPGKTHADLVVPGGGKNAAAALVLRNYIHSILEKN